MNYNEKKKEKVESTVCYSIAKVLSIVKQVESFIHLKLKDNIYNGSLKVCLKVI